MTHAHITTSRASVVKVCIETKLISKNVSPFLQIEIFQSNLLNTVHI